MGSKFAHFSIFNSNLEEAIGLLTLLPKPPNKLDIMSKIFPKEHSELTKKRDNPGIKQIFDYISSGEIWYIGSNHNWITVYSEWFSYGSIDSYPLKISTNNSKLFFAFSLFDGDVLTLSIIRGGKILTKHVSGSFEGYGMENSNGDPQLITEAFGIPEKAAELSTILKSEDQEQKVLDLEKFLNVELWINDPEPLLLKGWKEFIHS